MDSRVVWTWQRTANSMLLTGFPTHILSPDCLSYLGSQLNNYKHKAALTVSNNDCYTNWQNKCHNKTAVNCSHQTYEWVWIGSGPNHRASHTYHSTIFSSFSESAEVSKISRRVRWALWYLIKTSLFCTYFRTKSCENKNAYYNVCHMHTTQYTCKEPKNRYFINN